MPVAEPLFSGAERQALVGFLSGYGGLTRDAYTLDLRQYTAWCTLHGLHLFAAKRVDVESYRGDMEVAGRARATITRRLCTIAGFYRYAVEEELLDHSPATHVRRPRLDYESHATALNRNELGALLVAAGLGFAQEHALLFLLALNGLRIGEALGADIAALGSERGHRILTVLRKGGKIVTIPLAPRTARSLVWRSVNDWTARSSCAPTGNASIDTAPHESCAASPNAPGSKSRSARTPCGTPSSPLPSTQASRCATCKKQPATPTREPQCATTAPAHHWTDTPPTSSPPTSPAPPADQPGAAPTGAAP